jgi:hypothetical protein
MTIIANDPNPPNRDVGRPDSRWQLNVDSGRLLRANSGRPRGGAAIRANRPKGEIASKYQDIPNIKIDETVS